MYTPPEVTNKNNALPSPFSLRLTFEERTALEKVAGNKPLGAYIRAKLFEGEEAPRKVRTRTRKPVQDERALGQLLGELGKARLANTRSVLSGDPYDFNRLTVLLDCTLAVQNSPNFLEIELPEIPEPGVFPDKNNFPELRAASELAVFASGWAMLHEVRHVKHQQDGTSSTDLERTDKHKEEFSCDEFATQFILEKISDYAKSTNQNLRLVEKKRKLGIYFALFSLSILSKDKWSETESHPSLQNRIEGNRPASTVLRPPLNCMKLA